MCAMNSLMGIEYHNFMNNYKEVLDIFIIAEQKGLHELTMQYLLKNTKLAQSQVYSQVHQLIELNILDIRQVSICPYCYQENLYKDTQRIRCKKCKSIFEQNEVVEKLKYLEVKVKKYDKK